MTEITHMRRRRLLSAGAGAGAPGRGRGDGGLTRAGGQGGGRRPLTRGRGDGGLTRGCQGTAGAGRAGLGLDTSCAHRPHRQEDRVPPAQVKTKKRIFQIHTSRMTLTTT